jgi:hypothetical protein
VGELTSNGWGTALVSNLGVSNSNGWGIDLPESGGRVDGNVGKLSSELSVINVSELVSTSGIVLQVDAEDGHLKLWHDGIEECCLLRWLNGVKLAEGETDETVVVGVLLEGLGNCRCKFDGLSSCGRSTDVDNVFADDAGSARSVTVGDGPCCTLHHLERFAVAWVECGVLANCLLGKSSAEDPSVNYIRRLNFSFFSRSVIRTDQMIRYQNPWSQFVHR